MKKYLIRKFKLLLLISISIIIISPVFSGSIDKNDRYEKELYEKIKDTPIVTAALPYFWAKSYTTWDGHVVSAECIIKTYDNGFILTGYIEDFPSTPNLKNTFIMKLKYNGAVSWFRVYDVGGAEEYDGKSDIGQSITEVKSGNQYFYAVAGVIAMPYSGGGCEDDIYVMLVNDIGDPQWLNIYSFATNDLSEQVSSIKTCYKGSDIFFVVAGYTGSYSSSTDILVLLLNQNGNMIKRGVYDSGVSDIVRSIEWDINNNTGDLEFALCGSRNMGGYGGKDPIFLKLNEDLDIVIAAREYGIMDASGKSLFEELMCISKTSDDGYIMTGFSSTFTNSVTSLLVVKTDNDGNAQKIKTYDYPGVSYYGYSIVELLPNNGEYVLTGIRREDPSGDNDLLIVGLDNVISVNWARILQAGKPIFTCNTWLTGDDYGYSIDVIDNGFVVAGYTDSPEVSKNSNKQILVSTFDKQGIIRDSPPCCTSLVEVYTQNHDAQRYVNYTINIPKLFYEPMDPTYYDEDSQISDICEGIPGFELVIFFGAFAVAFLIFRRKKYRR